MTQTAWRDDSHLGLSTSKENYSGQLMLYVLGAHIKTLQVLRHTAEIPIPVLGLYMPSCIFKKEAYRDCKGDKIGMGYMKHG